jgi:hypothetical protein
MPDGLPKKPPPIREVNRESQTTSAPKVVGSGDLGHMSISLICAVNRIGHYSVCAGKLLNKRSQLSLSVCVGMKCIPLVIIRNRSRKYPNSIALVAGLDQPNNMAGFSSVRAVSTLHVLDHLPDGLIRDVPLVIPITDIKTYRQTDK